MTIVDDESLELSVLLTQRRYVNEEDAGEFVIEFALSSETAVDVVV